MMSNLDRYKEDLQSLIATGGQLADAIQAELCPDRFEAEAKKKIGAKKAKEFIAALPSFALTYQSWYSEAQVLIRQLLPDRLEDFVRHYEKPKGRKDITFESYRIEDSLQGVTVDFEKSEFAAGMLLATRCTSMGRASVPSGAGCDRPTLPRAGSRSPVSPRGSPARPRPRQPHGYQ